jgi:hypothetical protein
MIVREKPYEIDKNLVGILMDNYRKIQEKKPEGPGRSKEYAACPEPAEG